MEDLKQQLDLLIANELQGKDTTSQKEQISTRNSASSSIIREETLQNNQISDSKEHTESIKQLTRECRLEYLEKLKSVCSENQSEEKLRQYLKNYSHNFGFIAQEQSQYAWQLISSLDTLRSIKNGLTFISDKNSLLNGAFIFALLKDSFNLFYSASLVNVFENQQEDDKKAQLYLDEKGIEKIWNNIVINGNAQQNTIFFLDLQDLTPAKIIFIARLQKHLETLKDKKQCPHIIIYSDDILSAQVKELIKPQLEIVLDQHRMPQKITYFDEGKLSEKQKMQKIEQLIIDSLQKFKQTLLRFDILVFVKNIEEASYLKEHHISLIKEKLNVIDLTELDVIFEEKPFFEEEFKVEWEKQLVIRKQKEKELKAKREEEERIRLQLEKEEQERKKLEEEQKNALLEEERKKQLELQAQQPPENVIHVNIPPPPPPHLPAQYVEYPYYLQPPVIGVEVPELAQYVELPPLIEAPVKPLLPDQEEAKDDLQMEALRIQEEEAARQEREEQLLMEEEMKMEEEYRLRAEEERLRAEEEERLRVEEEEEERERERERERNGDRDEENVYDEGIRAEEEARERRRLEEEHERRRAEAEERERRRAEEEYERKRMEEEHEILRQEERRRDGDQEVRRQIEEDQLARAAEQQEIKRKEEEELKRKQEEERKLKEEEEIIKKEQLKIKEAEEEKLRDEQQYKDDLYKMLHRNKMDLYKANEFNIFIAKNHKQLRYHKLDNVILQIDSGEAFKVYFMDTLFDSVPVVSSKITREEALKRERLMGQSKSSEIYRLYERKEFLRLQKRDFLNLINLEQDKAYSEIVNEKCPQKQAIRILMQVMINLSENWFSCSSEVSAHVSILWSRMGDLFSIHNSFLALPGSEVQLTSTNLQLKNIIEKNQIKSEQYDKICLEMQQISSNLNIQSNPLTVLKGIESTKFSELIQQVAIEKYWKNICVYSGHRRLGFRHFESSKMINYAEVSSMNLIQERPFLIIPLQLQINSKNQYEIKQCIAIDHPFLLENAPQQFIEKHSLRLLKRQSLNLHEIEFFGISDSLFQYFEDHNQIIKEMEAKFDCYYEPNHHMDTITIHCDASQKEKLEKYFTNYMQEAQKVLSDETIEVSHGNNCILKVQKGGTIKEVVILQNDHVFIIDNLPQNVKEQDIIDLFTEYGDIIQVKLFTDPNAKNVEEKSISAEVLVADTEDSTFFVETFNQILFQGRTLQLRYKNHSFQLHKDNDETLYHNIFRWQTWKSKNTGKIEFIDESSVQAFLKLVQNKLVIDTKEIKAEQDKNQSKIVLLSGLSKHTDEQTIQQSLVPDLRKNIQNIQIDRITDVDRGITKASLIHAMNKVYNEQHQIEWVRRKENGFVEAKINFGKNFLYKMNTYQQRFNGKADILGQQKLYVERHYIQTFNYEFKLMSVVQMILKGNQELVEMQQKNEIKLNEKIVRPIPSKQDFLVVLKCTDENIFNKAKVIIQAILSPKLLDLRNVKLDLATLFDEEDQVDYSQIFTEIGQKKLREIEKKYPVFFKINLIKEDVRVFCTDAIYELINKEVEYFLRQSVRVKIPISGKNIRNILGIDGRGLEEFKNKTNICKIQLDYISKDVYMEGNSKQVDQAKNALLALLEEKNSSACVNNMPYSYEDCQVCSNTIVTGYRLQGCGHKFCLSCIMFVIDNSLGDVSSLPIKCPCCSVPVIMKDIKALMSEEQMEKMTRMSLNHYIQNNFQEYSFCVNENCKSVHSAKLNKYTCYECKKIYCAKCSAEYHFGMTCTVYQETEAKNIEFLIKEGARKCPNCGVFIIRIDGCYRVECRRCSKHICWKDNCMKFYETSSECYNHLDEKHGGYW